MNSPITPPPAPSPPALGPVVVGVDGSPTARTAALWAAAEAQQRGTTLLLVHAADIDRRLLLSDAETLRTDREAGRRLLAAHVGLVRESHPDLDVRRLLSRRDPIAGLRAAAGRRGTVVVGHRGHGGFPGMTLGSVALGVAARSDVPVVVVRGTAERPAAGVVTACVRDAADLGWLLVAAEEARARKAALHLLGVWNLLAQAGRVATLLDDLDGMVRRRVQRFGMLADRVRAEFPGLVVDQHVETGTSTPGTLIEASRRTDLLVMGRGRGPLGLGPALGRVAHALIHHAHCPVEIVPPAFAHPADDGELGPAGAAHAAPGAATD